MAPVRSRWFRRKRVLWVIVGLTVTMAAIQLVPYGKDHTPQAAGKPFIWNSPQAEAIARRSCYDCHSNETKWWWAIEIAPFSWLAQSDIDEARQRVNFSEWSGQLTVNGLQWVVNRGMPPMQYTIVHPDSKLTDEQKRTLVKGFQESMNGNGASSP